MVEKDYLKNGQISKETVNKIMNTKHFDPNGAKTREIYYKIAQFNDAVNYL